MKTMIQSFFALMIVGLLLMGLGIGLVNSEALTQTLGQEMHDTLYTQTVAPLLGAKVPIASSWLPPAIQSLGITTSMKTPTQLLRHEKSQQIYEQVHAMSESLRKTWHLPELEARWYALQALVLVRLKCVLTLLLPIMLLMPLLAVDVSIVRARMTENGQMSNPWRLTYAKATIAMTVGITGLTLFTPFYLPNEVWLLPLMVLAFAFRSLGIHWPRSQMDR